ncbi:MAG: hypothetical protein COA84_02865 [Robiginitomaculum sp.]|nr:MAG: hypothetical protein COA84_02865 [Robiginitomaculum sp.]
MLFLFNDRVFDIGRPSEVIHSLAFPLSQAKFDALPHNEVLNLVREEIFANPLLVHHNPVRAAQLATIMAAKSEANAVLAGPPQSGAQSSAQIGVLLAEVSLMTISALHSQQQAGTLTTSGVEEAVWAALR